MLKRLLTISLWSGLLSILAVANILAQTTPEARVDARIKVWTEQLKLTVEQQQKIRLLLLEREREWDRDHANMLGAAPADRQRVRDEQRTHMQSYRDKLHAVLTPEQQQKAHNLREMRLESRRKTMKPGAGKGPAAGRGPGQGTGQHRGRNW